MSVDGRFIKYLSIELNETLKEGRIQKISQVSNTDFLWMIRANNKNHHLYLSLSTSNARLHLIDKPDEKFDVPGGFCMFLRKHIESGIIQSIKHLNNDRIIEIEIRNINDLGDEVSYKLMIELFGRYANLIVTDSSFKILNAYKHIHPFDQIDRTIINGAHYHIPVDEKIDPENLQAIQAFFNQENISYKEIILNIRGISPLLAKAIIKQSYYQNTHYFDAYINLYNQAIKPTLKLGEKDMFYYIDIFQEPKEHFQSLSDLLNHYYFEQTDKEKVKQIHKYLFTFVKKQIKKDRHKLEKLTKDLEKAKDNDIYRIKGDIIIQDQYKIKQTDYEYTGFSYELNKDITLELDRKIKVIDNAKKYYKQYKKLKSAIGHINKQTYLTKHEINYFTSLKQQIESNYRLKDLEEIRDELVALKYLSKRRKQSKKKKKARLNYETYIVDDVFIHVGKNNLQNNYLTHQHAKKNDMWFHVQNQTGSHVIVQSQSLSENLIRTAAQLAAYYSKSKDSSSVAVDYTLIKNIKKIPGELGSFVSYTNQKTIYIDPDKSIIETLNKQEKSP